MYRDGIIDDDWYDEGDTSGQEPTWRSVLKGVGYIYGLLAAIMVAGSAPGQWLLDAVFAQASFLRSVVPGAWS